MNNSRRDKLTRLLLAIEAVDVVLDEFDVDDAVRYHSLEMSKVVSKNWAEHRGYLTFEDYSELLHEIATRELALVERFTPPGLGPTEEGK